MTKKKTTESKPARATPATTMTHRRAGEAVKQFLDRHGYVSHWALDDDNLKALGIPAQKRIVASVAKDCGAELDVAHKDEYPDGKVRGNFRVWRMP